MEEDPIYSEARKRARSERFKDHLAIDTSSVSARNEDAVSPKPSPKRLKGLSNRIEKSYFRLTSEPNPATVRPLPVLKLALENVKVNFLEKEEYSYACDQLKSIRQDLTVQNIKNRFSAHVYETHARIALESGDISEYNQCQSQLQSLRHHGVRISSDEFDGYRILHAQMQNNRLEIVGSLKDLMSSAPDWSADNEDCKAVAYAIKFMVAVRTNNTFKAFQMYKNAPHLSGYLIDYTVSRLRKAAMDRYLKAYAEVSVSMIENQLGFHSLEQCLSYLREQDAVLIDRPSGAQESISEKFLDCKATNTARSSRLPAEEGSAAAPVPPVTAAQSRALSHQRGGAHKQSKKHGKQTKDSKWKKAKAVQGKNGGSHRRVVNI